MAIISVLAVITATLVAVVVPAPEVGAQGPPYSGPQTEATGPAFFGPAPNPVPYCDSPTYFDPFPENVNPVGRLAPGGGPDASVTTNGTTMDFEITAEGDPGGQYPGFFPNGGDGGPNDQPKGIEMAADDAATVTLSAPLFYSQWVFTDVDRENEGFFVTPQWTAPGEIAIFGGDAQFDFDGSTDTLGAFNDTDAVGHDSEDIAGRVQLDMLGAVTGISMVRDTGSGQSGFAVGGGCEAAGAAKALVAGPTWNGSSFDVTFELRIRNNLPSGATVSAAILAAQANAASDFLSGAPSGIPLESLQLTEPLADDAFSDITVVNVDGALPLNPNFDGLADQALLQPGAILDAETNEVITLDLQYTPDLAQADWNDCAAGYTYTNQTTVSATAANVAVSDQSDDGVNAAPGNDNGVGGVDDPTLVTFPCPPAGLDIVKTVVLGPDGTCPAFADGIVGNGPALTVTDGDTVTYCISVSNPETFDTTNVVVSDPQNPNGDVTVGTIAGGESSSLQYDIAVDLTTPTLNTATATGVGPAGPLPSVSDTAVIAVDRLPEPVLSIVKTVIAGPDGICPDFAGGVQGVGAALAVDEGDTVTYCISVSNAGPGDATNVVVGDPQAPAAFDGAVGALAAGATADLTFDLTVSLLTPSLNTATVNGDGPYGAVAPDSDDSLIDVSPLPDPALSIVKTVVLGPDGTCPAFADGVIGAGPALPVLFGDTVTYCISVQNTSGSTATDVVITDAQAPAGFVGNIGQLGVGQSVTRSYDIEVDAGTPQLNTAVVNGNGPNGPVPTDADQAVIDPSPQPDPALRIVKTVLQGPDAVCPDFAGGVDGLGVALPVLFDEVVTYCISVSNISGSDATDVVITDGQAPAGFDGVIGDLDVGDEATRSFDLVVDAATPDVNTAAVGGSGPNGPVPDDTDQARISTSPQPDPVLQIVKTVLAGPGAVCPDFDGGVAGLGAALPVLFTETVTYCITVQNATGNPASNVVITDAQAPAGFDGAIGVLAVGAQATRSFDLVVDAATPDVNTATANGSGPNGALPSVSDQALISTSPQPDPVLQIVKTVLAGPGAVCPDFDGGVAGLGAALPVLYTETVTYCITVQNVGGNPATDVVITDAQAPAGFDGAVGDLAVGAEATRSFDLVVDAATPDVNTATANGFGPNGAVPSASDQALIDASPQPDPVLQIVKTVLAGPGANCPDFDGGVAGLGAALPVLFTETVTYCITVQNATGNPASNVVIADAQAPAGFDGVVGDLAVGAQVTRSFDLVVDAATPDVNTATADGSGPNGALPTVSDQARITSSPLPDPALQVVKTVLAGPDAVCPDFDGGVAGLGAALPVLYTETVTYCITVQNAGGSAATGVTISDPQAPAGFDGVVGDLAVGAQATRSFDLVVDAATPDVNTATVNGAGPNGAVPAATDQARITSSPQPNPVLQIVKTVLPGPGATCPDFDGGVAGLGASLAVLFGDTVTYCLTVQNATGNDATGVVISDPHAPAGFDGAIGQLAVGAQATRSFDVTVDADTAEVNTASASGEGPNGPLPVVTDQARIVASPQPDPSLDIVKTVVPGPNGNCPGYEQGVQGVGPSLTVLFGGTVTYCLSVLNSGQRAATDVVITDIQAPADFNGFVGDLGVEAEVTLSFDKVVDDNTPLVNTGRVDGQGPNGRLPADTDQAEIQPALAPEPRLEIIKTVVRGPNGTCPNYDNGIQGVGPALSVLFNETVTYCMSVTNIGLDAATDVRIADVQAPAGFDGLVGDLAVGAEATRSFDVVITANTNEVNTALVSGVGPNGPVPGDSDTALIATSPIPGPVLDIVKTVVQGPDGVCPAFVDGTEGVGAALPVFFGDTVTYCLTVRNTGLGAATNVAVTDPQGAAGFDGTIGDLAPSQEVTVTFDVVVDTATPLVNIATVTGNGPDGPVDSDNDLARIQASPVPLPSLAIVKTAIAGPAGTCPDFEDGVVGIGPGLEVMITDSVTYCISVRNVGDGDATDVVINDPQANAEILVGDLGSGATFNTTYDVVVTDTTPLINTAVASGQGPNGSVPPAEDAAQIVATDQLIPSITLTNTVVALDESCTEAVESVDEFLIGSLGDDVRWCFEITNTGNTSLDEIIFDDAPLGLTQVDVLAEHGNGAVSLPPGASIIFSSVGAIPDDGVVSVSSVVATPSTPAGEAIPGLAQVSDNNDAEVAEAAIEIVKLVVAGAQGDCAAAVNELSVNSGDNVTWCFTVTNTGGIDLRVTEITDSVLGITVPIPADSQLLTPGESVSATATSAVTEDVENRAEVVGVPTDPNGDPFPDPPVIDDDDTAEVEALMADLSIVKSVSDAGPVDRGTELTYTLVVTNAGPDAAQDVVVNDQLPVGLSYATVPELDGWACAAVIADNFVDGVSTEGFTCTKATELAASAQVTLTYTVTVSDSAVLGATFENRATVTSTTPDPDLTNNEDDTTTSTAVPPPPPPVTPEYPGPFNDPVEPEEEPDEVLELVITGSSSRLLVMLSMLMLMLGGVTQVAGRRRRTHITPQAD